MRRTGQPKIRAKGRGYPPRRDWLAFSVYVWYIQLMDALQGAETGFDWDEGNRRKSTDKRGVRGQGETEQVFSTNRCLCWRMPDTASESRDFTPWGIPTRGGWCT